MLKLDRPEWTGLSPFEGEMLELLAGAGLPVARSHGAVTVDGRSGIVLDRIDGVPLSEVLAAAQGAEVEQLAERFVELQRRLNVTTVPGLPPLVPRLRVELDSTVGDAGRRAELLARLDELDDGTLGVLHYDFHPNNVLVTPEDRWVVIDWLTVAAGPAPRSGPDPGALGTADDRPGGRIHEGGAPARRRSVRTRRRRTRRLGAHRRGRALGEGFAGAEADWLFRVSTGSLRLFV